MNVKGLVELGRVRQEKRTASIADGAGVGKSGVEQSKGPGLGWRGLWGGGRVGGVLGLGQQGPQDGNEWASRMMVSN